MLLMPLTNERSLGTKMFQEVNWRNSENNFS